MLVGGEMFTDASGEVSIGFTNITGTTACTGKLIHDSRCVMMEKGPMYGTSLKYKQLSLRATL